MAVMSKETATPDTAYLTSPNIVHPESNRGTAGDAAVAAAEAAARVELGIRRGVTVTSGSIKKGR